MLAEKSAIKDLDERVFGLMNPAFRGTMEAIGVLSLDAPRHLVGVFYSWGVQGYGKEFIHDLTSMFGEAQFTTLGKTLPPGFVCNMQFSNPQLRELKEPDLAEFRKVRMYLLEIRAIKPKAFLTLYFDTARRYWAYKPTLVPESPKEAQPQIHVREQT